MFILLLNYLYAKGVAGMPPTGSAGFECRSAVNGNEIFNYLGHCLFFRLLLR